MKNVANNVVNSIFLSLLVLFILMAAFFLVYDMRAAKDRYDYARSLKYEILLKKTLVQSLALLPVLVIFVFVFSFTVLYTLRSFQSTTFSYHQVAVPSFIILLILLMLIIASEFLFIPNLGKNVMLLEARADTIGAGKRRATALNEQRRYSEALGTLDILLEISEETAELVELRKAIQKNLAGSARSQTEAESAPAPLPSEPGGYAERANAAFDRGDFREALFYLERALRIRSGDKELKALYERTKREIDRQFGSLTKRQKEAQLLVRQKEKGIGHLNRREYYEAYEIFLRLSEEHPSLGDLKLYLQEAEREIQKEDFLPAEIRAFEWLPSRDSVVFVDSQGYIDTVGRVVSHKGRFYFFDVARYNPIGVRVASFAYGKWIEAGGGDRPGGVGTGKEPGAERQGRIRLKNGEGYEKVMDPEASLRFITPSVLPGYLASSRDMQNLKGQMSIFDHLAMSARLRASGFDVESGLEYLARSSGVFFSVYVLALVLSAFAWSRRSIHEFPPAGRLILFFAVMPFLCYFLHNLYLGLNGIVMYTHQYAARALLKGVNVLVYTLVIHLGLSVAATFYYLSQRSTME